MEVKLPVLRIKNIIEKILKRMTKVEPIDLARRILIYCKKKYYEDRVIFISKPSCTAWKIMTSRIHPGDYIGKLEHQISNPAKFSKITFPGISGRCDWIVLTTYIVVGNAKKPPKTVFLRLSARHVTVLEPFYNKVLPLIQNKFVLLTGSADYTLPNQTDKRYRKFSFVEKQFFYKVLNDERITHWFAENHDETFEKMSTLPIGINSKTCGYFSPDDVWRFTETSRPIFQRPLCMICADILREGAQWEDRAKVANLSQTAWKEFSIYLYDKNLKYDEWLRFVGKYPFLICVHGGGLDPSPKAWEAIAVGTIPIIKHSPLDDAYAQLPVAFVDEWDEGAISHRKLEKWLVELGPFYKIGSKEREAVLERLTVNYWWKQVESKL
jgi:hypothetical protein